MGTARRKSAPPGRSSEDRHLAGSTELRMRTGHVATRDGIAVAGSDASGPSAKPHTPPFEAVIPVPEAMAGHAEQRVEVCIRRCDHHGRRRVAPEYRPLAEGEPVRVDVLDALDEKQIGR